MHHIAACLGLMIYCCLIILFYISDDSPHVNGHKKHSQEESEDNSNEGESENESLDEEEEDSISRRKLIRKTARVAVCKIKKMNDSDEEEEDHCITRRQRNHLSNPHTSAVSDEKTETLKAEKYPHQNGRRLDPPDLKCFEKINHKTSKSQELGQASKTRTAAGATASKSGVRESSASRRKIKSEDKEEENNKENESSSGEKEMTHKKSSLAKKNKPRRTTRSQSLDVDSNTSDSEQGMASNQRRKKKEADSSEEWQQSDESEKDKKSFNRRPTLRALPKKKYITDSEEDQDSEGQKELWNGRRSSGSVKNSTNHCPKLSEGSKRKHISTSESEAREENGNASEETEWRKPSGRRGKRFKKLSESDSGSGSRKNTVNGPSKRSRSEEKLSGGAGQRRKGKRKHSESYSNDGSTDLESQEESSNESQVSSSGSQSSLKRYDKGRLRGRKRGTTQPKSSASEMDSDTSFGKSQRATRIRTRNLGKRTVNYRDSE